MSIQLIKCEKNAECLMYMITLGMLHWTPHVRTLEEHRHQHVVHILRITSKLRVKGDLNAHDLWVWS